MSRKELNNRFKDLSLANHDGEKTNSKEQNIIDFINYREVIEDHFRLKEEICRNFNN